MILRPVYPFESAVVSDGALQAADPGTVFDSFNSGLATASTNGQYDSTKRLADGTVLTKRCRNHPGRQRSTATSARTAARSRRPARRPARSNNASLRRPAARGGARLAHQPAGGPCLPHTLTGSESHPAGTATVPTQYAYTGLSGNLHVTYNALGGTGQTAIVYVGGDFTGGIEVDPGVVLPRCNVTGSIITNASKLQNDGPPRRQPANLRPSLPRTGASPVIRLNADRQPHRLDLRSRPRAHTLTGSNDVSGALVAASFQTTGARSGSTTTRLLALNVGPILRYQIAGWQEITN